MGCKGCPDPENVKGVVRYRRLAVEIHAIHFNGANGPDIVHWLLAHGVSSGVFGDEIMVESDAGTLRAPTGWYVVKEPGGGFTVVPPGLFEVSHRMVPDVS